MRSKAAELEILDRAIAELGPGSYLGPWLSQVRADVVGMLASDVLPDVSLLEARDRAAAIVADAERRADAILTAASDKANALQVDTLRAVAAVARDVRAAADALDRRVGGAR